MQKNYSGKSSNNKFLYCIISENLIHCVKIPSYFFKGLLDMYVDVPRHTAKTCMGKMEALIEFSYSLNGTFPRLSSCDIISMYFFTSNNKVCRY